MAKTHTISITKFSAVVVCRRPDCYWRGLAHTPASVWRLLGAHARDVHHDPDAADYCRKRAAKARVS